MKFHVPSFLLGCGVGYATHSVLPHLRPLLVEIATVGCRVANGVSVRFARVREDLDDVLAEAKARVAGVAGAAARTAPLPQSRLS